MEEFESYDVFGAKRSPTTWQTYAFGATPNSTDITDKGYTGQQQLDALGLIHMNGRVQDPYTGRFVSADPTVPDPSYSQSFNRFAYVYNNPMNSVDPSGFDCESEDDGENCSETDINDPETGTHIGENAAMVSTGCTGCVDYGFGNGGPGSEFVNGYGNVKTRNSGTPSGNLASVDSDGLNGTSTGTITSSLYLPHGFGDEDLGASLPNSNSSVFVLATIEVQGARIASPYLGLLQGYVSNIRLAISNRTQEFATFLKKHVRGHVSLAMGDVFGGTVDITVTDKGVFVRPGLGLVEGDGAIVSGDLYGGMGLDSPNESTDFNHFNYSADFFGSLTGDVPGRAVVFGFENPITSLPGSKAQVNYLGGGFGVGDAATLTVGFAFRLIDFGH